MGFGKKLGKSEVGFIVLVRRPLYPPVWNYDDRIGKIWMLEVGSYDQNPMGDKIGTADPSMGQGGSYDNR